MATAKQIKNVSNRRHKPTLSSKFAVGVMVTGVVLVSLAWAAAAIVNRNNSLIDEDSYQAVILDNSQSYFGKLRNLDNDYAVLSDVYYVSANQQAPAADGSEQTEQKSQLQLQKLVDDVHGPQNQIFIARDSITYWENLRGDSKIIDAIQQAKEKND